jgi:hypothetical protein
MLSGHGRLLRIRPAAAERARSTAPERPPGRVDRVRATRRIANALPRRACSPGRPACMHPRGDLGRESRAVADPAAPCAARVGWRPGSCRTMRGLGRMASGIMEDHARAGSDGVWDHGGPCAARVEWRRGPCRTMRGPGRPGRGARPGRRARVHGRHGNQAERPAGALRRETSGGEYVVEGCRVEDAINPARELGEAGLGDAGGHGSG